MEHRARRWFAGLALALAVAAALDLAWRAQREAREVLRVAVAHRREAYPSSQDRQLGSMYMRSIRAIRETVPRGETVYLIDETPHPSAAPYLALHYLAPRRVVMLGAPRDESPRLIQSRLPASARWAVIVPGEGEPLVLVDADELRPRSRRRGR